MDLSTINNKKHYDIYLGRGEELFFPVKAYAKDKTANITESPTKYSKLLMKE